MGTTRPANSEILAIVDRNDNVIGKGSRDDIHKAKLWHRVSHVLLFNANNELLLPVRSKTRAIYPNVYDCSISEHVLLGEDPRAAAKRGLKEELGIEKPRLIFLCKVGVNYGPGESNTISILYKLKYDSRIRIDLHEVYKAGFLPSDTVKAMLMEEPRSFAPWAAELLRWYFHMGSKAREIR